MNQPKMALVPKMAMTPRMPPTPTISGSGTKAMPKSAPTATKIDKTMGHAAPILAKMLKTKIDARAGQDMRFFLRRA